MLAGGILLPSSLAGVHDPACPHHGGHAEGAAAHATDGGAASGGRRADGHRRHAGGSGDDPALDRARSSLGTDASPGPGSDDCRCGGGLCALVFSFDPPIPAGGPAVSLTGSRSVEHESAPAVRLAGAVHRLQPPSTGPPPEI